MSTTDNAKFEELCVGFVLSSITKEEEKEFKSLLKDATQEQEQLYQDMQSIASEMALLAYNQKPSENVKEQLLEMAWASVHARGGSNVHYLSRYRIAAAAAVLFLISSFGLFFFNQNLESDLENQKELVAQKETTIRILETEVEQKSELLAILEARDVDLVLMDGQDVNPNGFGKVVWDKDNGQALLQVANMPAVPTAKEYQLWILINGQPLSAGVFAVNNPERDNFFKIQQLNQSADQGAFAITLEPEGGSPQPTGAMYMMGAM
ncbi:MAG: anti-sigma factor [Balneola sp.]|nr:anti-sigma factor [Balneola sp.]MBO6649422.1 anti-sigma factor [Balneola sp.]MBO6711237.1 anti-sigma factor [Balneola sp.]MBO6800648.1 anti-sigma factor [Balneola sp.]MBO6869173.1 anti-sigma factor [Balneola sp.]